MTSGMDYEKEAVNAGAAGFIVKPFDWQELSRIVEQILGTS
jgi:YesN/AraC family two-component response regulator